MKTMKKFVSLALALMMALALMAPAFAEEENPGKITIQNPEETPDTVEHTYNVYRVFDMTRANDEEEGGPVSYTASETLKTEIEAADTVGSFFEFTPVTVGSETKYVVTAAGDMADDTKKATAAVTFSEWLRDKLKDNSNFLSKVNTADIKLTGPGTADAGKTSISVPFGYYYVSSTVGSLIMLDSTNPTVTIKDKNEDPKVTKKDTTPEEKNVKIGDNINYTIRIDVVAGSVDYYLEDTLGTGLKLFTPEGEGASPFTLKIENKASDGTTTEEEIATGNYSIEEKTDNSFKIKFTADYLKDKGGQTIIVTYQATILNSAAFPAEGTADGVTCIIVENTAKVTYGDQTTPESKEETPLYKFDLVKTDKDKKLLDGAEFELYSSDYVETKDDGTHTLKADATAISLAYNGTTKTYRTYASAEDLPEGYIVGENPTKIVVKDGKVTIEGLKGTYYLKETKAPDGYNILTDLKEVKLTEDDKPEAATITENTYTEGGVQVVNNAGGLLPSTGGIGTTIFYVVGGVLVVGAAILLMTRKRVRDEE